MFRSFEGQSADHVWQQVVEAFRAGDGVLVQPSRGGATREILKKQMLPSQSTTPDSDG